ncbi:MAG: hypothetical protein HBSAPP01_13000 [Candidatus Brocadia sapporoensis]|nr:MAG: hypothetical protein HBSAPP01_13000 [Candidatus Brocadia sapporoensis]
MTKTAIAEEAKKYSDFPKKSSIGGLLNVFSDQVPIILIGILYNPIVLGFYSLSFRILYVPTNLIGSSVAQVFYEKATVAKRHGTLDKLVKKTTIHLFVIIIIPMVVLFIFGKPLFSFVFGKNWMEAGHITQIFVPFILLRFIFSPQKTVMMILRRLDYEVKFNLLFTITQIGALVLGYYWFNSYLYSFIFMSICGAVSTLILGVFVINSSIEKGS